MSDDSVTPGTTELAADGGFQGSVAAPDPSLGGLPPHLPDQPSPAARRWRWWKRGALAALILFVVLVIWLAITAPLSQSLKPIAPPSITLLSAEGKPIARRGAIIEKPVDVTALPKHVPQAFMAIEDRRFYSHPGIDPLGIARAAWRNMVAGGVREGGSTITQQLAKVAFLSADRTAARKLREVLIAFWLEAWLSKDEILSRYLSNVYFGDNVYGLRAASLHYFSRPPEKLTVPQAAMLAGLLKAPSRLSPAVNLKGARERSKLVMAAMVDAGFIDAKTAAGLKPAGVNIRPLRDMPTGTYFADWVLPEARDRAGAVYQEQRVTTTLDSDLQRMAERAVRTAGLGSAQVALVAMRPDGEVVAMIGGRSYADSPFNRVTQAKRQPGSTFKLFVYLAAMRAGMSPDTVVEDTPLVVGDWAPANSGGRYRGKITLRQAFALSSNVAAVRLAQAVGLDQVVRAARDLGITTPLGDQPSLALGTSGTTLLEMTAAYAAVAGNSYPVRAHGLPEEERSWFDRLWDRKRSFDSDTREKMLTLLAAAANDGTGRSAALNARTYGKTGTTQDNRDAIFIGFAGDLVTGVWIGRDDNKPMAGVGGGGLPARIWRAFMADALRDQPRPVKTVIEEEPVENLIDDAANAAEEGIDLNVQLSNDGVIISTQPLPGINASISLPVDLPGQRPSAPAPADAPVANAQAPANQ
ncbi:transglycosylase domain-containing protein [Sphingomonas sp. C3-2]|uniref:transglycosylase domain-containing protein n=1 Tax=Sphingomonas sp. C3-2 TaxID=3062169 RepID=UPI00294B961C|nr:transglycosylase domain-containing protein [Sphingomonas sp. C3-2]WOK38147.1 transglycosylase domain-containing protein [Sphingomonas sp. C3-2]